MQQVALPINQVVIRDHVGAEKLSSANDVHSFQTLMLNGSKGGAFAHKRSEREGATQATAPETPEGCGQCMVDNAAEIVALSTGMSASTALKAGAQETVSSEADTVHFLTATHASNHRHLKPQLPKETAQLSLSTELPTIKTDQRATVLTLQTIVPAESPALGSAVLATNPTPIPAAQTHMRGTWPLFKSVTQTSVPRGVGSTYALDFLNAYAPHRSITQASKSTYFSEALRPAAGDAQGMHTKPPTVGRHETIRFGAQHTGVNISEPAPDVQQTVVLNQSAPVKFDVSLPEEGSLAVSGNAVSTAISSQSSVGHSASASVAQVVQAIVTAPSDRFEVSLSPEELGRVRIQIHQSELGLQVNIATERPETLDLLRKNIALLSRALADLGYESASFEFSEQGHDRKKPPSSGRLSQVGSVENMPVKDVESRRESSNSSGLDLRF